MPLRLKEDAWFELYKTALAGAMSYSGHGSEEIDSCEWAQRATDNAEPIVCQRCPSMIDVVRSAEPKPGAVEQNQRWGVVLGDDEHILDVASIGNNVATFVGGSIEDVDTMLADGRWYYLGTS